MKRVIKFRGKRLNGDGWVYGDLYRVPVHDGDDYTPPSQEMHAFITNSLLITHESILVDPETVGQFTGFIDKKGKEIYEDDICDGHSDGYGIIKWAEFDGGYNYEFADTNVVGVWEVMKDLIIIGNIHDNPNLLK